jgi:hypothetical protein
MENDEIVGLFVLIGAFSFVGGIIWLFIKEELGETGRSD